MSTLSLSDIIKERRNELGLTLKDLEKLSGVTASYINRLENNSRNQPSIQIIQKLIVALKLDQRKLSDIFPELIPAPNDTVDIIELITKENLSYNGANLSILQKNEICTLIDYILKCYWSNDSKLDDIKIILDLVNNIKNEHT